MMRLYFYIILLLLATQQLFAQQIVMHSNYMVNGLPLNPAVAGTKTFAPIVLGFRRQWTGIREAPVAQHISYHTYVAEQIGIGAYAFNDVAGPVRRTGLMSALSIQIKSSYKTRLSFGIAGSFSQFMIDRDKLITEEPGDQVVLDRTTNQLIPDLATGLHWYSHQFHLGISIFNILQTKSDLFDIMTPVTSTLDRTLFVNGSYRFGASSENSISFEPAAIVRIMTNAPIQFDLSGRLFYNQQLYIGSSYRHLDALAFLIGFDSHKLGIGYAYDIGLSNLNSHHSGSHEIVLTFKTRNNNKNTTNRSTFSNRVYDCPSFK
ncbi:MAG: hypothetical protein CL853_09815 [Crocinitomicaceae bacterium]|nr:hypothetical protein [Crocinitomicaceae bacterium]|tara:strand:+ start:4549 stop:5505 length:957 start_codon:yes stop_codon:yes gene_type:complete